MALLGKNTKYKWQFGNIGGTLRVKLTSGADIAHIDELDTKMWTVLSCPVKGLEIDERSLAYIDCDNDGKIRVNDIVQTSKWITGALRNPDLLLDGNPYINIEEFDTNNTIGKKLHDASKQILCNLGKEGNVVSLDDTADSAAIFAKTKFNGDGIITPASTDNADEKAAIEAIVSTMGGVTDRSGAPGADAAMIEKFYASIAAYKAWNDAAVEPPFGADTQAVIAAYNALDSKIKDFFMRSKLAAFSPSSTASLDVQTSRIEAISGENLACKGDEIAAYPIARITGKAEIDLNAPINPAWTAQFNTIKGVLDNKDVLVEKDWSELGNKFAAYTAWLGSKAGAEVEPLGMESINDFATKNMKDALLQLVAQDAALAEEAGNIEIVNKALHLMKDFYRLLRNFITFNDFYTKDKSVAAIFQSGTLIIDQRACRFCMNVADMGKHAASAAASGMYLVYCDCTRKGSAAKLQIVAAITVGDIGNISVGKNAIYYNNAGEEWDATVTKIIDNPISVAQSFWSPYRRMATAIENLINKSAAEKDSKMMANATSKINAAPAAVPPAGAANGTAAADPAKTPAPPFDIAKFAGIFAAIGMAVGMIGTALASLAKGIFALSWWQLILAFTGLLLIISGPAMIMAWMKLRRRNIAPLLNANGWAINAAAKVSIPFGATLTDIAKYPKIRIKDPYKKNMGFGTKLLITLMVLAAVAAAYALLFM